jgi:hypothetical protein
MMGKEDQEPSWKVEQQERNNMNMTEFELSERSHK